jgi:hypothetical protein
VHVITCHVVRGELKIEHEFAWLNFTFRTAADYDDYIRSGDYTRCMLAGVKVTFFLAVELYSCNKQ